MEKHESASSTSRRFMSDSLILRILARLISLQLQVHAVSSLPDPFSRIQKLQQWVLVYAP